MKKAALMAALLMCGTVVKLGGYADADWPRRPTSGAVDMHMTVMSRDELYPISCAELEWRLRIPEGELRGLTLTQLPGKSVGELTLDGVEAPTFERLDREAIDRLVYEPADAALTARIGFIPEYGGCRAAALDIRSVEDSVCPPELWGAAVFTLTGMSHTSQIVALDQFGNVPTIQVVRQPTKGKVAVEGDHFTYMPNSKAKGGDSFIVVAVDDRGVYSQPCEIQVDIAEYTGVRFADLDDSPYAAEATLAAHLGLIGGRQEGAIHRFAPKEVMTGAQFLAAVNAAVGVRADDGAALRVGAWLRAADDLPDYYKTAVNLAAARGYINRLSFDATRELPASEAVGIICRAAGVGVGPVDKVPGYVDALPVSALAAYLSLESAGLLPTVAAVNPGEPIPRDYAAALVYRLYEWHHK